MKDRPRGWSAWFDRRARKLLMRVRSRTRALPVPTSPRIALMCDCEGHFAGEEGGRHAEAGLDALLSLLHRCGVTITFNIVAELCRSHPDRVQRIAAAGHEIACHGWRHERPRDLNGPQLDAMLREAQACFASLGLKASGFRSPQSAWSLALVRRLRQHGFSWSAERDRARRPYRLCPEVIRVPVLLDDWDLADRRAAAAGMIEAWRSGVARARGAGRTFAIGVHEWVVGREPELVTGLEALIREWRAEGLHVGSVRGLF